MNTRRKPIFARNRRNIAQPHWLWVAISLLVLVAVTLFDAGPAHHTFATSTPDQLEQPASAQAQTQLQASN
ncbi:MAG: hypothetical protein R3D05_11755 [Dongiaceae bacterium]